MKRKDLLKSYLLDAAAQVRRDKEQKMIVPTHMGQSELRLLLMEDFVEASEELVGEGKLICGETLNGDYLALTDGDEREV